MITVRYFAAAAEAAGRSSEQLAAATAGELRAALLQRHPDLTAVLPRCSVLAAGVRLAGDDDPIPSETVVDVLPPFAGG